MSLTNRKTLVFIALLAVNIFSLSAASKPWRDSLSVDGPYILYTETGTRVITVDATGAIQDRTVAGKPQTLQVTDHRGRYPFEVKLREIRREPWRYDRQPDKVFVMSDPHGRLDCVASLLQGNNVIDKDLRWNFGRNHLVVIGDIFDRGEDVVQIFWLFYKLQQEAEVAGGRVSMFLGNHEPMVFSNDLRYTKPKYTILARELGMEYRTLFGPQSELGRWIASWNTIGIIGRDLFVHAGLGGDFYRWDLPIPEVNRQMSRAIFMKNADRKAQSDTLNFLYGSFGPIWYRGLVQDEERRKPVDVDTLDLIRARYGVEHIVVGHTIFRDIRTFYGGRVFDVNVDNRVNQRKRRGRAVLIEGDAYYVVGDRGRKRRLL